MNDHRFLVYAAQRMMEALTEKRKQLRGASLGRLITSLMLEINMRFSEPYAWRCLFVCNMKSEVRSENTALDLNLSVVEATFTLETMEKDTCNI